MRGSPVWKPNNITSGPTRQAYLDREHNILVIGASDGAAKSQLFAAILDRIQRFGVPPPLVQRG